MRRLYEPPTPEEVRDIKENYNLTVETCAYISCVSQRTFARYMSGEASMNGLLFKTFKSRAKRLR